MFIFLKADIIVRINFILYFFRSAKKPQWGSVFERKYSDEENAENSLMQQLLEAL